MIALLNPALLLALLCLFTASDIMETRSLLFMLPPTVINVSHIMALYYLLFVCMHCTDALLSTNSLKAD